MFSDASAAASNGASNGGSAGPSDLARKLKESQDRQNVILKKIADKERQLNMQPASAQLSASTSAPASSTSALNGSFAHNLSSASLPYYQGMTAALSPSAMHQSQQQQQQQNYSFAPAASSSHIPQTLPQRSPALNGYGGGGGDNNYLSVTTASAAPAGLDFSMMDDRLTSTLADDESTMLRVRQLASQLRHTKSEGARKDILLANATQQISELNRLANEYASARASWEAREQQHLLRDNEYNQTISELQHTIHSLTGAESQLRTANANVTKEKLALERGATIQLGDLEAQVVSLRGDLAQAQQAQKSAEYETSLARRELSRVQNAFQSFEQTQLSMNQAMEEKYFALKKEMQFVTEKKAESSAALEKSQNTIEEMEANRDSLANEVSILTRSKQAQSGMIDSLQRELLEAQNELATLRIQVETIPALKAQAIELTQTKAELRATQQRLQSLEVSSQGQAVQLAHFSAENQSLKALQASLESSLNDTRDRLQTVTGPQGDLETQRSRAQFLDAELNKSQIHAANLASQLDTHIAGENQQIQNIESVQGYATTVLNTIHRSVDAALAGAGAAEVEALEREFAAIQTPQIIKESVRGAGNNLRAGVRAVASELNHLRTQQAELISQVESLSADATAAQQALRELDNQLQTQQAQAKADAESMARLNAELTAQREANTALNQQNHTLINELDERTVVIRLWAVELENIARSLLTASATEAGLSDSRGPGAAGANTLAAADFDGGRSSLGAAAPLSVSEHWPSIRAAFNDILHHVQQRSKGTLAELADCNRSRKQQRQDVCRLSDELAAVSAQLASTTEAAHKAARQATQSLHDSESLRLTEAARTADEHRARMSELQTSYEKLVADLQDNLKRSTDEIIARTQENHNQLTALRILYKALKPLQSKLHEMQIQKSVLNSLYTIGCREHAEVRALMIAMTGVPTPTGVRAFVHGAKRSLFRAGVLAVLAARRFQVGPRKGAVYGRSVVIRGEQVNLIDNVQLSADASQSQQQSHCVAHTRCGVVAHVFLLF